MTEQELFSEHNISPFYYVPLPEGHSKCFICTNIDVTENGHYLGFHQYEVPKWFCFNCIMQPLVVLTRIRKNNEAALNEFLTGMEHATTDARKNKVRNTYRKSYNGNCGMWRTFLEACRYVPLEHTDPSIPYDQSIPLYQNQHLNQWFNFP